MTEDVFTDTPSVVVADFNEKIPSVVDDCITEYCRHLEEETTAMPRTIYYYKEQGHAVWNLLLELDESLTPWTVGSAEVVKLLDLMNDRDYAVSTKKGYIQALRTICSYFGNNAVKHMDLKWPHDTRPSVDWLNLDQALILQNCPKTPNQKLAVHLELCMGLRRIEVARLLASDINFDREYIDILGKGSLGGKPRRIPFHPDSYDFFTDYFEVRKQYLKNALMYNPSATMPKQMLIWQRRGRVSEYADRKHTGIDKLIYTLHDVVGFEFGNHTLRRTFGRMLYRAGVPLLDISQILGHDDVRTTIDYLGLMMDRMSIAISSYPIRQNLAPADVAAINEGYYDLNFGKLL